MPLQENALFDLDLGVSVDRHTKFCQVPSTSCDLLRNKIEDATSNCFGGDAFTRKYII